MTILVATDLTANADRALDRAVMLAHEHADTLVILHVVDDQLPLRTIEERRGAALRTISDHVAALRSPPEVMVDFQVLLGDPAEVILTQAEKIGAWLIVLGTHGHTSMTDYFLGTTAEQVLDAGRFPVLMVQARPSRPYEQGIMAMDFSSHACQAMRAAFALCPACKFTVVHAYEVPFAGFQSGEQADREVRARHEADLQGVIDRVVAGLPPESGARVAACPCLVRRGSVAGVLREEVRAIGADVIVVGTHGRTGIAHALLGSVAKDLLANPPCDVLVVRAETENGTPR